MRIFSIILLLSLAMISCKEEPEEVCYTCPYKVFEKSYGDVTIRISNVITPNNYKKCDSMVYAPQYGAYVEPFRIYSYMNSECSVDEELEYRRQGNDSICPCLTNEDSQYNDSKNSVLYIEGIENFPYNTLTIYGPNSSKEVLKKYENYSNGAGGFQAYVQDTLSDGKTVTFKHLSGTFTYNLRLYMNASKSSVYDEIEGGFTVIRVPQNCPTSGCIGKDNEDPLIHK